MDGPRCAVLPRTGGARVEEAAAMIDEAVRAGGGEVVAAEEAEAIVWLDPADADGLAEVLDAHRGVDWVQLPWAGIEPFVKVLDRQRTWTCGKGVYAEPVAEHALALGLAGLRGVAHYARQRTWSAPRGHNLQDGRVAVLGGGGVAEVLIRLLQPFDAEITVVRRHPDPMPGVAEVVGPERLHEALGRADLVVLALALTPETEGIIDAGALAAMRDHAWLVNVARGRHVDTDALVEALEDERIGGAGLDVTDPEPLPDDHPLWSLPNAVLTPHVGNTPEMGRRLLAGRIRDNVQRRAEGRPLLGPVDVDLGY